MGIARHDLRRKRIACLRKHKTRASHLTVCKFMMIGAFLLMVITDLLISSMYRRRNTEAMGFRLVSFPFHIPNRGDENFADYKNVRDDFVVAMKRFS